MKTVVSENPTSATAFLPNLMEAQWSTSTPSTVTNWLDILRG